MAQNTSADYDLYERGVLARFSGVDAGYGASIVLRGVEFETRARTVSLVTGPTAAGKTTLMHLLRLSLTPRGGRAVILGHDIASISAGTRAAIKRRIGYVAENPVFVEHWSALANIAMPLRVSGAKARDYADDVRELVDFVGLGAAAELPVEKMSGAERRRTAIARALAAKPDLILADDPTAGLSPGDGRRIVRLLAEMRRVGAGVVITSQDESLAECGPIQRWRIERGRISPIDHPAEYADEAEATE